MVEFDKNQQTLVQNIFLTFNREDIKYVIPRSYRNLPKEVPGGDIDILVHANDFPDAIEISKGIGFVPKSRMSMLIDLLKEGYQEHQLVLNYLLTEPSILFNEIRNTVVDNEHGKVTSSYSEYKGYNDGVMIHLMNHLGYTSPLNGQKIRVSPSVEQKMFIRSNQYGNFFRPSKPDELAHLICRCLFDKEGDFPNYYIERCDELWRVIRDDEELKNDFDELLSLLFFEADIIVRRMIQDSDYEDMKKELIQFSKY